MLFDVENPVGCLAPGCSRVFSVCRKPESFSGVQIPYHEFQLNQCGVRFRSNMVDDSMMNILHYLFAAKRHATTS